MRRDPSQLDQGPLPGAPRLPDPASDYDAKILRAFIRGGKLVSIPAHERKRGPILRYLMARCFAEDRAYPEREVNERLAAYHEDVAALRRYLVDAGLMTRDSGEYRRARADAEPGRREGEGVEDERAEGRTLTVVLMGVAGCGKTAVMGELARRLGWPAAEGDEFHSPANVAKMAAGVPLTDADRRPWLSALAAWIGEREAAGEDALMACSALRRAYRDVLRDGHPSVRFVHLDVPRAELERRISSRTGHYMPVSLLDSQLATLEELGPDERGVTRPGDGPLEAVVERVLAWLDGERGTQGAGG